MAKKSMVAAFTQSPRFRFWAFVFLCVVLIVILSTAVTFIFRPFNVTKPRVIVFGQSAAFKSGGPVQMGRDLRSGVLAAFHRTNKQGGIHGHPVRLISMDDGYDPIRASLNVERLIKELDVFAIISPLGTPTTKAFIEQIIRSNGLLIGPYTGAAFLRYPFRRNVVNLRMSYAHEISAIAFMLERTNRRRIAVFYQNDSYGKTILTAMEDLSDRGVVDIVSKIHYKRNTTNVAPALEQLMAEAPDAEGVVMAGTSSACAKFIQQLNTRLQSHFDDLDGALPSEEQADGEERYESDDDDDMTAEEDAGGARRRTPSQARPGLHATQQGQEERRPIAYFSVSFVGAESFSAALGTTYKNIYVTQCVPDPANTTWPVIKEFQEDLATLHEFSEKKTIVLNPTFAALEGYLTARLATHVLTAAANSAKNPTSLLLNNVALRKAFLQSLYGSGIVSFGDFRLGPYGDEQCTPRSAGCPCNQGIHSIYMSKLQADRSWKVLPHYKYNVTCANINVNLV